jgi:diguanylate cyclase (GGDEF)-like protein
MDAAGISGAGLNAADLLYTLGTVVFALGLLGFIRNRTSGAIPWTGLLDGAVVLLCTGLLAWWLFVQPTLQHAPAFPSPQRFRMLYPLGDMILLALAAWLASAPETRSPSLKLLVLGLVAWTVGDALYHAMSYGVDTPAPPLFVMWLLAYVCWGAAALHPSRHRLLAVRDPARVDGTAGRFSLVALAMLAVPLSLLSPARPDAVTAGLAALLVAGFAALLLWWRLRRLHGRVDRQRDALSLAADTDALTGLPNRRRLLDTIANALESSPRVAVLVIDIDRFGAVNEAFGHAAGDALLRELAQRWRSVLPQGDGIAYMGADEFCVVMPSIDDESQARERAARLQDAMRDAVWIEGTRLAASASMGLSIGSRDGNDPWSLLRQATIAMRRARQQQAGLMRYTTDLKHEDPRTLLLLNELRDALSCGQLRLQYQPQVRLQDMRVIGVEALLRWQHPVNGLVPPGEFIPLMERTDLMADLTRHVLGMALGQCAIWERNGMRLNMAVNLSMCSMLDVALPADVRRQLELAEVPPQRLALEITESAAMSDPVASMRTLQALSASGVQLSIDDYGTGYSSLAYLQDMPVEELKLDKAFIDKMVREDASAAIVGSTIRLARQLGMRVVAEGVEDAATAIALRKMHCFAAQGYWFSPPVDAAALPGVIAEIERRPRAVA